MLNLNENSQVGSSGCGFVCWFGGCVSPWFVVGVHLGA